ncbi:MAG: RNA polymerase sigma factor [Christensenellales bacterium]|jgi:RNA polymerase sigma factor (sigma-70 family)
MEEKLRETKEYKIYLKQQRKFVTVNREQYLAYYREVWRIRKHAQYHKNCFCPQKNLWKCDGDCLDCEYYSSSNTVSLEKIFVVGDGKKTALKDILPDLSQNVEIKAEVDELHQEIHNAISSLNVEEQQMCRLYMDGMSERYIAEKLCIPRSTFKYRWEKVKKYLKERLKDFI